MYRIQTRGDTTRGVYELKPEAYQFYSPYFFPYSKVQQSEVYMRFSIKTKVSEEYKIISNDKWGYY